MTTAIVFVQTQVDRILEVAEAIMELDGVSEVYSVTGSIDLVAIVHVRAHEELSDLVAGRLNKIDGVRETETHIAFRTYSKHELDAGFDLGND